MKEMRILPIAILAVGALLGLKVLVLISEGGIARAEQPASAAAVADVEEGTAAEERFGAGRSAAREDVLESLFERRRALDGRERELDLREGLLKSAETRIEARIAELKEIEMRIGAAVSAEEEAEAQRFAGLVTMYESMKPKDAATIFNGLEMAILVRVAAQIKARSMAEILAEMEPKIAQQLTVALSAKGDGPMERLEASTSEGSAGELPKIVGTRPAG